MPTLVHHLEDTSYSIFHHIVYFKLLKKNCIIETATFLIFYYLFNI